MSDEIPSYKPKGVPAYITEEESTVLAMLAERMICPVCQAPVKITLSPTYYMPNLNIQPGGIHWKCTNPNCDQYK